MNAEPEIQIRLRHLAAVDRDVSLNVGSVGARMRWLVVIVVAAGSLAALYCCDPCSHTLLPCPLHAATGIHCDGCGIIRATYALLHGRFLDAIHFNALWVASIPLLLYTAMSGIWVSFGRHRPLPWNPVRYSWFWSIATVIVVLFFLLRNLPWYPMILLAPPN